MTAGGFIVELDFRGSELSLYNNARRLEWPARQSPVTEWRVPTISWIQTHSSIQSTDNNWFSLSLSLVPSSNCSLAWYSRSRLVLRIYRRDVRSVQSHPGRRPCPIPNAAIDVRIAYINDRLPSVRLAGGQPTQHPASSRPPDACAVAAATGRAMMWPMRLSFCCRYRSANWPTAWHFLSIIARWINDDGRGYEPATPSDIEREKEREMERGWWRRHAALNQSARKYSIMQRILSTFSCRFVNSYIFWINSVYMTAWSIFTKIVRTYTSVTMMSDNV